MRVKLNNDWDNILKNLFKKRETQQLFYFLKNERKQKAKRKKERQQIKKQRYINNKGSRLDVPGPSLDRSRTVLGPFRYAFGTRGTHQVQ